MASPNTVLYEGILEAFEAMPTAFSVIEVLKNPEAALLSLNANPRVKLLRAHTFDDLPTFLYEVVGEQAWILIDKLREDLTRIVVRAEHSMEAMTNALLLATNVVPDTSKDWGVEAAKEDAAKSTCRHDDDADEPF